VVQEVQGPREVGEEDEARLQRADEQRLTSRVVGRDLLAELRDPGRELLCGEIDLPDGIDVVGSQEASFRPYR
jgi:hypothetical protein